MRLILFLIVLALCVECSKKDTLPIDKVKPEVVVMAPEADHFYHQKDTVFINAAMSDDRELRYFSIHVHDDFLPPGKDTVFVYQGRIAQKSFKAETYFVVDDPADKNYTIYFDVTDQAENFIEKKQNFYQYH